MVSTKEILKSVYFDVKSPACFSGVERVYREAKRRNPRITRKHVENFLAGERTYTVYRSIVRKFPRLKTIASGLNTHWQADLAVFINTSRKNDGYNYLLVCVDVLSRKAYVEPVKSKRSDDMIPAFEHIFERSDTTPWYLFTDLGLEFNSKTMLKYFEEKEIEKRNAYTNPVLHAAIVERMNRTIKDRLHRYFAENNTLRWVDVIQDIVKSINNSVNRSTGMKPSDVTYKNAESLRRIMYEDIFKSKKPKFQLGDSVRFANKKMLFVKGDENFTDGIYEVERVYTHTVPIVYTLKDYEGNHIKGYFYEQELVKANRDTAYKIKQVLKTKIRNGEKLYYVKYAGFKNLSEWVRESDLV